MSTEDPEISRMEDKEDVEASAPPTTANPTTVNPTTVNPTTANPPTAVSAADSAQTCITTPAPSVENGRPTAVTTGSSIAVSTASPIAGATASPIAVSTASPIAATTGSSIAVATASPIAATTASPIAVTTANSVAFVGTLFKTVVNSKQEVIQQKVLLAPLKKDGALTRIILPRPAQTTANSQPLTTTSPAINVVFPPKHMNRGYVISTTAQQSKLKPSISILSRNTVVIDPQTSQPVQSKFLPPNIIRQKGIDSKILTSSVLKPFNIQLQAKKLLASSSGGPLINLLNSKPLDASPNNMETESLKSPKIEDKTSKNPDSEINADVNKNSQDPPESANKQMTLDENSEEQKKEETDSEQTEDIDNKKTNPESESEKKLNQEPEKKEKPNILSNYNATKSLVNGHKEDQEKGETGKDKESKSPGQSRKLFPPPLERARKRKGPVLVKGPVPVKVFANQQENLKLLPGAEEFDPFKTVEWDSTGLGALPGCDIKMTVNEFGMLEVHDDSALDANNKKSGDKNEGKIKERDPDEIYCCVACSCYGLLSEFYNENYCSIACRDNLIAQQQAICNKTEEIIQDEMIQAEKKKRKLFKFEPEEEKTRDNPEVKSKTDVVIDLDESSNNSEISVNKLMVKKTKHLTENNHQYKIKKLSRPTFKIKRKLTSILPPSRSSVRQQDFTGSQDITTQKFENNRYFVAQDLDPGEKVEVKVDSRYPVDRIVFPWGHYLSASGAKPTWIRLFSNPFPDCTNKFTLHSFLEAIDPEHQSHFCAVKIVEIRGFRIKLHFEGYPEVYDFWVNADSPNIFPCGFCSQHGIQLHPPLGFQKSTFNWLTYHKLKGTIAAPQWCFPTYKINNMTQNLFKVGMKLEAVDRKNTFLVCVASVAGVIEDRILVHFDSWGDMYDYWVNISSPYIHPVGWSKENNHVLTPPNGYRTSTFSWEVYLKKTGALAAPGKAFCLRPHLEFKKGTKLEAIDKRSPHLLRVATVKEVLPYQIKIHFDGFPDHFGYWVDDDCPDIHPVGWGAKVKHPVEHPPIPSQLLATSCPTPGCVGDGHFRNTKTRHRFAIDCPYSMDHIYNEHHPENRLDCLVKNSFNKRYSSDEVIDLDRDESEEEDDDNDSVENRWHFLSIRAELARNKRRKSSSGKWSLQKGKKYLYKSEESGDKNLDQFVPEDVTNHDSLEESSQESAIKEEIKKERVEEGKMEKLSQDAMSAFSGEEMEMDSTFESMQFDSKASSCLNWTVDDVCDFIKESSSNFDKFRHEEITGESLLMLSLEDLKVCLGFSSEEALIIYQKISDLRRTINPRDVAFTS